MAKIRKVGQALVITSGLKAEDIKRVGKFGAKSLQLINESKEPTFAVAVGNYGSVGKNGISFDKVNSNGFAEITIMTELADKNAVMEDYGYILANLVKIENQVTMALDGINEVFASVSESIEVE